METIISLSSESEYNEILRQAVAVLPWWNINKLISMLGDDDEAILYSACLVSHNARIAPSSTCENRSPKTAPGAAEIL